MSGIPTEVDVSPAWLTAQLRAHGVDATVVDVSARQIGTGQIGKCLRYTLGYAPGSQGPASLVGKFPSDDPVSRATGVALRNFLKEVRFYQQLASRLSIRTPYCYFAEIDGDGPDFMLLLEDMAPAEQGDQLAGCNATTAHAAVMQLVGLHAPSWNDGSLGTLDWLGAPAVAAENAMFDLYTAQLPGFLERYGPLLAADEAHIIAQVAQAPAGPLFHRQAGPTSLVHVDYRLDNLLFAGSGDDLSVTAVDWQSITLGAPLNDVAYFMGAGMLPEHRRVCEAEIVQAYYARLCATGVEDFSWDECWLAYRRGTFAGFGVTVVASMLVQRTARGDEMFTAMAQRHARHALDLGADEFLQA